MRSSRPTVSRSSTSTIGRASAACAPRRLVQSRAVRCATFAAIRRCATSPFDGASGVMNLRHTAALVVWFLALAAALIFSGASLSGLTIRDIEKAFLWRNFLLYFCISILGWYLVAVLKRKYTGANTTDNPR